eukprot:6192681-Pyramimonas_sp.AAC.1
MTLWGGGAPCTCDFGPAGAASCRSPPGTAGGAPGPPGSHSWSLGWSPARRGSRRAASAAQKEGEFGVRE